MITYKSSNGMKKYRVTIFNDCHSTNNQIFRNQSFLEADSIARLARKYNKLVSFREERVWKD